MKIPISISRDELINHEVIFGRTNSGKSVAMLVQYQGITRFPNVGTILFAVESSQLRCIPKNSVILDCGTIGNYRYNPFKIIPGISIDEFVDDLCRVFGTLWLGIASMGFLKPILLHVVKEGKTMKDLVRAIQNTPRSELREKILNRLAIIDSQFFGTEKALDLEKISGMHIIFLIESLDSQVASFFFNDFVSKLMRFKRMKHEHSKNVENQFINTLFIDEAQRFLPGANLQRDDVAFHPLMSAIAQSRKLGIGFIFAFQQPSLIHDAFLANAGMVLAGAIGNEDDMRSVRNMMGLNREQLDFYRTLSQRVFLFRKNGSPVFPVVIPNTDIPEIYADREFIANWNEGKETEELIHFETIESIKPVVDKDDYFIFIEAVNNNPFHPVTYYYDLLKEYFALQKASRIRNELEEKGWIRVNKIPTGLRYVLGLEPTEEGLSHFGLEKRYTLSRGADFPHSYIAENVKRYFEKQGKTVLKEHRFENHYCDLFVQPDLAIEVAIGNKTELEANNIRTDLNHVNRVLVVGNNQAHLDSIKALIPNYENVNYEHFYKVINGKYDE